VTPTTTSFRLALALDLAAALGVDVVPGVIDGPVEQDVACVFPGSEAELETDANYLDFRVVVRVFRSFVPPTEPTYPADPSALEDLAWTIRTSLSPAVATHTAGVTVFYRVVSVDFLNDEQGIEAVVAAQIPNPFAA
jgi:hypothetical protein